MFEIRVNDEQERLIKKFVASVAECEVEEGVEPSGYQLLIEMGNRAYGFHATVLIGGEKLDIGDVEVVPS